MAVTMSRRSNPEGRMALLDHLKELRNRLFKAAIAVVLGTVVGFLVYQPMLAALIKPIRDLNEHEGRQATLNFDGVASSFDLMIQVSVFLGLIIASPVWLYQLWAFIVPGLHKKERRLALSFVAAAVPLFLGGVLLAWLVLPNAVRVLTDFTPSGGSNFISAQVYLSFVLRLLLAFGIAFLLPVVLFGLNLAGLIKGRQLVKSWRITVFLVCLFSAMAAPGADAMSMFYLAVPMLVLFFAAIGLCLLNDRRRDTRAAKVAAETEATADQAAEAKTYLCGFTRSLAFDLDPFQREACLSLQAGRGVLVAAPTGAGKTIVGEFAIYLALQRGLKAFYTTPIKALSNQKYTELADKYGAAQVGLLTGDTSINGEAHVVVMTTEVLRNMLYADSATLDDLGFVVMDEVHYLADRFRGAVWEEVIIHLPET